VDCLKALLIHDLIWPPQHVSRLYKARLIWPQPPFLPPHKTAPPTHFICGSYSTIVSVCLHPSTIVFVFAFFDHHNNKACQPETYNSRHFQPLERVTSFFSTTHHHHFKEQSPNALIPLTTTLDLNAINVTKTALAMPLRRLLNTIIRVSPSRPSDEDVVMTDATTSDVVSTPLSSPLTPFSSVDGSTSLGKRRHEEASEHDSQPTAGPSSTSLNPVGGTSSPLAGHPSTPATPSRIRRPDLTLNSIDPPSIDIPEPSFCPPTESASPVPTEIALDLPLTHEERMEALRAAGIKVRDFAYEPMPNSCKAPEVFDPVPSLIAADWHMRNPTKNYGLLTPRALFRLIKIGWLTLAEVITHFSPVEFATLKEYNDLPDEQRYPFVVPLNEPMPTPSQRVRMRRKAGLTIRWDDYPDSKFFGYNPTGLSDDEEHEESPPPRVAGGAAVKTEAGVSSQSEAMTEPGPSVPAEPKAKRRKVKSTAKTRKRTKPVRRECSRPEV
jgi:hypothetical protein